MGRFAHALAIAVMAGMMAGCGIDSIAARGGGTLVLADNASGTHYELGVEDGALTLSGVGAAGTAERDAGLIDVATGACYSVEVASGALRLQPGGSAGAPQIALTDIVTAKTYELVVSGGALTLFASDGGER